MLEGHSCARKAIGLVRRRQPIPAEWGGGVNKWPVGHSSNCRPTSPPSLSLVGHFAAEAPDFNLLVPDQIRFAIFERHLKNWIADKERGKDTMPNVRHAALAPMTTLPRLVPAVLRPSSSVADNDLAVGRAVEAISPALTGTTPPSSSSKTTPSRS